MIRQNIKGLIGEAILEAQDEKLLPDFVLPASAELRRDKPELSATSPEITIERAQDEKFGDYSSNVALKIAGFIKKSPMEVAEIISLKLKVESSKLFEKIEVVQPGFINFFIKEEYLQKQVAKILDEGENYGVLDIGQNKKVQVEFISANPTGPLTLGNGRGGFMGDALANVLKKAGYDVEREYYMNDTGYQVEVLGHSILGDEKAQYKGEYIEQLRKEEQLKAALQIVKSNLDLPIKKIGEIAAGIIWNSMIRPTIEGGMKIKFDAWASENELYKSGTVQKVLDLLKEKNATYEKDGATWLKSSEFDDDKDRVLITSADTQKKGEPTYLLADIAYHYNKFVERKFDHVIDIWGADHHGYMARLQAAGKASGAWDEKKLEIIIMQLVRLFKDGQEVKMSKRAGTYVTLDELLDEIPLDVARFFFLMYGPDTHLNFSLDLAKERSEKNPVYYVQYAHARIASILKKATSNLPFFGKEGLGEILQLNVLSLLKESAEMALIKQLMRLPEIIEDTAADYQVQRLPQYALELVRAFHKFYENCRVIDEAAPELTQARLALVEATRIVLKNTLDLMGISAPEAM